MVFRALLVMVVGVLVGFVFARSVRVPAMPAVVAADIDFADASDGSSEARVLRLYDVDDIIRHAMRYQQQWQPTAGSIEGSSPPAPPPCCFPPSPPNSYADCTDALLDLIQEFIDPESWFDNGGSTGSIRCFGGRLVVTQSPANQVRIALLLDQLRASPPLVTTSGIAASKR